MVLKTKYKALNQAKSLFSTLDVLDTTLDVTASKKKWLLEKILADFQLLNPHEKSCSFHHVKKKLADKYDIKMRSISNFSDSQLEN